MIMLSRVESNISHAWARVFIELMNSPSSIRHPALITINIFFDDTAAVEDVSIKQRLDRELLRYDEYSCETVASTIFPISMWNPQLNNDSEILFERYEKAWPGIERCRANQKGVYFRRLTSYSPDKHQNEPINQLQFIIDTYLSGNHRKSALQASIIDPTRDHTNQRQKGFPCLQQISFTPLDNNKLSITGYYATQYQFEKAYGNYLGLYRLGQFMAKQLELELIQVNCIAAALEIGNPNKAALRSLAKDLHDLLSPAKDEKEKIK